MKKRFFLLFAPLLFLTPVLQAELRVVKLLYSRPEAIKATLQQLFGNKIKAATAPSLNAVVIDCDDPEILKEIDKLVAMLDRKPAMLKFSLKRGADASSQSKSLKLGSQGHFENRKRNNQTANVNTVIALEHRKARITQDMIHIFSYPTWYGQESEAITISHGLRVSGHIISSETAQIDLWYSHGQSLDSETLLTTIQAPLARWISLGGNQKNSTQNSKSTSVQKSGQAAINKTGGYLSRQYFFKVELLQD
jgi:hypothetical protein